MSSARLERMLWGMALLTLLGGGLGAWRGGRAVHAPGVPLPVLPPAPPPAPPEDTLVDAFAAIRNGNLFRAERAPADSARVAPAMAAMPQGMPRPQLVLRGLVGGPPWSAIVDGIPGTEGGTVLRVGQSIGGITLRAARRDTINLQGKDTAWTLTIRRAW